MTNKVLFPNEKIIVTKYFDCHQDWGVPIPGFFIIAARRKIVSIAEFTDAESKEFMRLLKTIRRGMNELLKIRKVQLFQDEGTSHDLFHLWVVPRYKWMEKFGVKVESLRPIISHAKQSMTNEKVSREVKKMVGQMREYMRDFS